MRHFLFTIAAALILSAAVNAGAQNPDYETYFTPDRLRVDFILAGDAHAQHAYLAGLKKECAWAGSHASLIDPFRYGEYMFEPSSRNGGLPPRPARYQRPTHRPCGCPSPRKRYVFPSQRE